MGRSIWVTLLSDVDGTGASTSPLPLAGEGTVREARPLAPSKDFTGGSGRSGLRARSAGFFHAEVIKAKFTANEA